MTKKPFKRSISGALGIALAAGSLPVPPAVYAEENVETAETEESSTTNSSNPAETNSQDVSESTLGAPTGSTGGEESPSETSESEEQNEPQSSSVPQPLLFDLISQEGTFIGSDLRFYLLDANETEVPGLVQQVGDKLQFKPQVPLDETANYKIKVVKSGFYEYESSYLSYGELSSITRHEIREIPSGNLVTFVNQENGESISSGDYVFKKEDGSPISIPSVLGREGVFDFSQLKKGDVVKFDVVADGYKKFSGQLTVDDIEVRQELALEEIDQLNISSEVVNKIYGDETFSVHDKLNVAPDFDGQLIYSIKSGNEVIELSNDGSVKILAPGDAVINVKSDRTDIYEAVDVDIPIKVAKKNLGTIDASSIEWDKLEFPYDGNSDLQLTGSLKKSLGIEDGDEIKVKVSARLSEQNVGLRQTRIISLSILDETGNYEYSVKRFEIGPEVEVVQKEIELSLKKLTVPYGSSEWNALKQGNLSNGISWSKLIESPEGLLVDEQAAFDKLNLDDYLDIDVKTDPYLIGDVENALIFKVKDPNEGNFRFILKNTSSDVSIVEDNREASDLWDLVSVDIDGSSHVYKDGDTVYVKPGGEIKFSLKDTGVYNKVNVIADNLIGSSFSDNIVVPESTAVSEIRGRFYLSHSSDATTKTSEFELPNNYKVDYNAPIVEFEGGVKKFASIFNGGETEFENAKDSIEFAQANSEKGYSLSITSKDEDSGLKNLKYSIVKITSDADAHLKIREVATSDSTSWKSVSGNSISVPGTEQGYYIVIVKAEDNVGNSSVFASNGIIIDTANPVVSIEGLPDLTKPLYSSIDYKVNLFDPVADGIVTGISSVKVIVKADGKEVSSTIRQTNSFTLGAKDLYGVDLIDSFSDLELAKEKKSFDGAIDVDSNNISLEVIAYDRAGNEVSSNEIAGIKIDKTKASVAAYYDSDALNSGKYTSKTRKLTVSFKDKNFVEDNAKVELVVDGVSKIYSISEVRDGNIPGIRLIGDRKDSQFGTSESDYTADRTNTYTLEVGGLDGSHSYFADVSYEKNGEQFNAVFDASTPNSTFVVDNAVPETKILFSGGNKMGISVSENPQNTTYLKHGVSAILSIEEDNFDPSGLKLIAISRNSKGEVDSKYVISPSDLTNPRNWSSSGNVHTYVLPDFLQDSNYQLSVEFTDLAGNKAPVVNHYFTIDRVAPEGVLNIDANGTVVSYSSSSRSASVSHVSSSNASVTRSVEDLVSGVKSIKYFIYNPGVDSRGSFSIPSPEEISSWSDWTGSLPLSPNGLSVVYLRMEDHAGNVSFVNTSGAILLDNASPVEANISVTTPGNNGIYSQNVALQIAVEDVVAGGTYSGLNTVKVEVLNSGQVTQSEVFAVGGKVDRVKSYSTAFTVNANLNNSNDVVVRVTTTDWAGNTSVSEKKLVIDITKPRIEVVWDNSAGKNGRYYNGNRTATVRVYERNFNPASINLSVLGGNASIGGWTSDGRAGTSDDAVHTATIVFAEDGDYTFSLMATDLAGNRSDYQHNDVFTIDKTVPTINVSWDKGLVNNKYVAGSRTATITVVEKNFNAASFTADIKALLDAQGIPAPSISGWVSNGNTHVATLTFTTDGDYSFNLNFEDLAGNKATAHAESEFTVDVTKPEIVFEQVANNSSNKGEVRPIVRFSDRNFDKDKISLTLKGKRHAAVNVTGRFVEEGKGGFIMLDDFPYDEDTDDVYTLTAHATDRAGNSSDESLTFSVNRFGSNYFFSEETEKYLDKYYHKKEKEIVIHEVNTDELKTKGITVIKDGSSVKLGEDDFKVEEVSVSGWREYVYTIKSDRFKDEGHYEISIDSEDAAGNKQSNKIKEKPASFVIDKTKPSAVVTGVEDKEIYNSLNREIGITATDNVLLDKVVLYVDGEEVATFNSDVIEKSNGELSYILNDSKQWQVIEVESFDKAGNDSKSERVRVLITPDTTTRVLNNIWFKVLGGASLGLIGFFLFLLGRKKKEESEEVK